MKKLNYFLDKAPLWQNYLLGWVIFSSFTSAMFYGFQFIGNTPHNIEISGENCILIGATIGMLSSLMFTWLLLLVRKSTIFWNYSEELNSLIEAANTKEELQSIFDNEFQELVNKAQGNPHIFELTRINSILRTKYKYI